MPLPSLLQRKQPAQPSRNHGRAEARCEQSYSRAERSDLAVSRELTFGKYENAPSAVDQIAGEGKTFAEPGVARQGEDIEQRDYREISEAVEQAAKKTAIARRATHRFQALSIHCYGQAAPQARRQGVKDKSRIKVGDVIRDHERWAFHGAKIFAAPYARPPEHQERRASQRGENRGSQKARRPALSPARIIEGCDTLRGLRDQLFQSFNRIRRGEFRFAQIHLIAVFECAEKLDAVDRA